MSKVFKGFVLDVFYSKITVRKLLRLECMENRLYFVLNLKHKYYLLELELFEVDFLFIEPDK
jgi:hypothetical protein